MAYRVAFYGTETTAFERQAQTLGLNPEQWRRSRELREWAKRHCDVHFIPEELLSAWGLTVDAIETWDGYSPRRAG